MDVTRTFPDNTMIQSERGQLALTHMLRALMAFFPNMGYAQHSAFVAGIVLIVMGWEREEEAFWILAQLFDKTKGLPSPLLFSLSPPLSLLSPPNTHTQDPWLSDESMRRWTTCARLSRRPTRPSPTTSLHTASPSTSSCTAGSPLSSPTTSPSPSPSPSGTSSSPAATSFVLPSPWPSWITLEVSLFLPFICHLISILDFLFLVFSIFRLSIFRLSIFSSFFFVEELVCLDANAIVQYFNHLPPSLFDKDQPLLDDAFTHWCHIRKR